MKDRPIKLFLQTYGLFRHKMKLQSFLALTSQFTCQQIRYNRHIDRFQNIAIEYFPTISQNRYSLTFNSFLQILSLYACLNIHRFELFNILESFLSNQLQNLSLSQLNQIYKIIIDQKHKQNKQMRQSIQQRCLFKFYHNSPKDLPQLYDTLLIFLYDENISSKQLQKLIKHIQNQMNKSFNLKNIQFLKSRKSLGKINSMIKLHQFNLPNGLLKDLLQQSQRRNIQKKIQTVKKVFDIDLKSLNHNSNKDNRKYHSVFENIFANKLHFMGYLYSRNILIGYFEYDFVINGTSKHKYYPFQHNQQIITKQQIRQFQQMTTLTWISKQNAFKDKIIINLHGPTHFINSDLYGNDQVTRTQDIKIKLLKLYGYKKYSNIDSRYWSSINQKTSLIQNYIKQIIDNPKNVNSIL